MADDDAQHRDAQEGDLGLAQVRAEGLDALADGVGHGADVGLQQRIEAGPGRPGLLQPEPGAVLPEHVGGIRLDGHFLVEAVVLNPGGNHVEGEAIALLERMEVKRQNEKKR